MINNGFELQVRVHGKPVREYPHGPEVVVEGRTGSNFLLRIANNTAQRALAVVTIDGLSVMDGKAGNFHSGGYVLEPGGSMTIPGWRLNNTEVAKFLFSKYDKSYAAQLDAPTNAGIISCAWFYAKPTPWLSLNGVLYGARGSGEVPTNGLIRSGPSWNAESAYTNNTAKSPDVQTYCSNSAPLGQSDLGTGFGQRQGHAVLTVTFDQKPTPEVVQNIRYGSRAKLEEWGVDKTPRAVVAVPTGFPGEQGCKPPAGWNG